MKTSVLFFCFYMSAACGLMAQELTLDQVLDKYYQAGGKEITSSPGV